MRAKILLFILVALSPAAFAKCELQTKEQFAEFFDRFAASKEFAVARTQYPFKTIKHEYGIDANGKEESQKLETVVSKAMDVSYPSLSAYMQSMSLESKRGALTSRKAVVDVFKPDTDWLLTYHFQRYGNCWYLQQVEDHSL